MTETNAEVKKTLKDQLDKVGQTKESFDRAKTAYNKLYSAQKIKADFESWDSIGAFFYSAKSHLKEKKVNMNSGGLTDIQKTYFPELNAQDVSNSVWLHEYKPLVVEWIQKHKRKLSNPASIKQAIRKQLVADKADTAEFQAFKLKPPAPKAPTPDKDKDKGKPGANNKTTLDDNLKNLNLILNRLENINSGKWSLEQFKQFETLIEKLDNFYEDLQDKLSKKKLVKVNEDVMKKMAAN